MSTKRTTATVTINLTYDGWKDLESALMERARQAADHEAMRDRLNGIRSAVQEQVVSQRPRWR